MIVALREAVPDRDGSVTTSATLWKYQSRPGPPVRLSAARSAWVVAALRRLLRPAERSVSLFLGFPSFRRFEQCLGHRATCRFGLFTAGVQSIQAKEGGAHFRIAGGSPQ